MITCGGGRKGNVSKNNPEECKICRGGCNCRTTSDSLLENKKKRGWGGVFNRSGGKKKKKNLDASSWWYNGWGGHR